ncbi:ERDJ3B [Symbiodinium microadriaticum]|nr:ERDJ3B [Symbiodinium microadriaticum]
MSLQNHPDKVGGGVDATNKFNEIKNAKEILSDTERRKIYDTFGVDLGEERPEMEVWSIGMSTLLSPMGGFVLKTIVARSVLWLVDWVWIGRLLMLLGLLAAGCYAMDIKFGNFSARSEEALSIFMNFFVIDVVIILNWLWPLLADAVCVFYLVAEIVSVQILMESWKIGVGVGFFSLFLAWLVRGWWRWIVGLEILLAVVLLIALTISSGIVRLWIDSVFTQHGEKLKEWRINMRARRRETEAELDKLRKRVQTLEEENAKLKTSEKRLGSGGPCGPLARLCTWLTPRLLGQSSNVLSFGVMLRLRITGHRTGTQVVRRATGDPEDKYESVFWSSEKWFWEVKVKDRQSERLIFLGDYADADEAAKVADCAELALDQMYPPENGRRSWKRNLPKATIYQDEVDAAAAMLHGTRPPPQPED